MINFRICLAFLILYSIVSINAKKDAKNLALASTSTTTSTTTAQSILTGPEENSVKVVFMDLKREEFVKQIPKIKYSISRLLSNYCKQNECGSDSLNFTAQDINFLGKTEKEKFIEDGRFITTKLYAKIPTETENDQDENNDDDKKESDDDKKEDSESNNVDEDLKVLSKNILEDFMIRGTKDIIDESKVAIAYVNDKLAFPPRNNLDNWIIISVSCGFCVLLIILNFICQRRRNKQLKDQISKKPTIYKSDSAEKKGSSSKLSSSSQSLKNKGSRNDLDERENQPLNQNNAEEYDDDPRYLEPVQRFPIPDQTPMLMTNTRPMSNIRTNPHIRLTQV